MGSFPLTLDSGRATISFMPRLTIELNQRQIDFLEQQAREANLTGAEDAAVKVIDSVERLRDSAALSDLLRAGLDSGPPLDATDPAWWQQEKAKFLASH